jgi:hypothetical protein
MQTEGRTLMEGTPLDDKASYLLEALNALGPGWHSRAELSAHLGKVKLSVAETIALDMLASISKIDRAMHAMPDKPQVNQYVYRIKE